MNRSSREDELFAFWQISADAAAARRNGDKDAVREFDEELNPHEMFTEWPALRIAIQHERDRNGAMIAGCSLE